MSGLSLRFATLEDFDIIQCFASNIVKAPPYNLKVLPERTKDVIKRAIIGDKNDMVVLLICQNQTPIGVLGAAVAEPLFCNSGEKQATELLLYITTSERSVSALRMLLQAYKYWAKLVGCTYISYASYKNGIEMNRIKRLN